MLRKSVSTLLIAMLIAALATTALADDGKHGYRDGIADTTLPLDEQSGVTEGFDDITTLSGSGWATINNSNPLGTTDWFQGNDGVFAAHAGGSTAYIAANFNNTGASPPNTISNWLLTPETEIQAGDQFSFWTRTVTGSTFPDRLEVRMSLNGASIDVGSDESSVGDFTTLLLEINPTLSIGGFPEVWTEYTVTITGVSTPAMGRIGFRYFVTDAGPVGANSNYFGIDTYTFIDFVPTDVALTGFGGDVSLDKAVWMVTLVSSILIISGYWVWRRTNLN